MSEEEVERLIKEDNVDELSNILNSYEILRNNFNTFLGSIFKNGILFKMPLLHVAVKENCKKVVEYLLSQDFVDKSITCKTGNFRVDNIYHVICGIRGADELFSIIERNVPHHLLLNNSRDGRQSSFHVACFLNNVFIVKRVHEILESLNVDLRTHIKSRNVISLAAKNKDIEVLKYISSIDGIPFNDNLLLRAIRSFKLDRVVFLLNFYLCQSIPSNLHNQFHIFQFKNHHPNSNNNTNNNNNNNNNNMNNNNNYNDYLKIVEKNFNIILDAETTRLMAGNRIWHYGCRNKNLDVVQLIFSLKGIQAEILNSKGENVFLIACLYNSNIKVIKYIHKLFPSFINSQINQYGNIENAAYRIVESASYIKIPLESSNLECSDKLQILHYLYLNGIDIHFLSKRSILYQINYHSIYTESKKLLGFKYADIVQYLKVISQDFDYLENEHDDEAYRKPSFWKQFDNNNNYSAEQSIRINQWKNRFEEHVLHHLSKMIQEWMLK